MTTDPLPSILCLHGSGTSAAIFKIQTIRLRRELQHRFSFVFIDAPFQTDPDPGVLPVFADAGPYFTWVDLSTLPVSCRSLATKDEETKEMSALQRSILRGRTQLMPARTVELLEKTVREQIERDGRGFVGVIGFSMGGRLAAGLLLEQQERLLAQQRGNGGNASGNGFADCHLAPAPTGLSGGGGGGGEGQSFKFGVFICATSPPITKLHDLLDHDSTDGRGDKITLPQIDIPTLHILGLNDPWIAPGELLATTHFNQVKTTVRKLDMGHHLPTQQKDNMLLVEGILDMAKEIGI
ncbi:conserved hypothetical protein [Histoplasma capsulatum G186AR]|uniref:Serine hydrolase domain-containing protein n=2 Tax=Ajellomyces capsulatus TaxID=5037 RepID=C0NX26_AJECG|nr:uncharacterized protein HCBG_08018 [Histoplasma capsulatum G186AR]EEH03892.1 conserved hypothetical protein [Histoplasma capsulatum G186AR]KAG5295500.1 esterase/lipase superfamily domain-containing protein [Histoplasma capsulatum]QSS73481.1 esterase/lipase superfamily domain-containing protein [Histoplasma capsulatum G186AR]